MKFFLNFFLFFLCPQCNTRRLALNNAIFFDLRDRNDPKVQCKPMGYVCPCGHVESLLDVDWDKEREKCEAMEKGCAFLSIKMEDVNDCNKC